MATFLDLTVLRYFSIIFTFILAFVIVYGFLEVFKMFGSDRKGLHAWVALAMAFLVVLTSSVVNVIKFALPWIFIFYKGTDGWTLNEFAWRDKVSELFLNN